MNSIYEMSNVGNYKDNACIEDYIRKFDKYVNLQKADFFRTRLQIHSDLTKCTLLFDRVDKKWQNKYK